MKTLASRYDVVIVGGGHNGLTAAAYLAQAGRTVLLVEQADHLGGATVSTQVFPGVPARLSRFSYLVSLLPRLIVDELGLRVVLRRRPVASWTPLPEDPTRSILVDADPEQTRASFTAALGNDADFTAWQDLHARLGRMARRVFPTFLNRLTSRAEIRRLVGDEDVWRLVFEEPLGFGINSWFQHDAVRGMVLTDALVGTFADASEASLRQNRCFLYHVVGRGTGDWLIPVGGMGTISDELARVARAFGAKLRTGVRAEAIAPGGTTQPATVHVVEPSTGQEATVAATHVLLAAATPTLHEMLGGNPYAGVEGSQLKVNLALSRLPRLRADVDPVRAFSGTVHVNETASQLRRAHEEAAAGHLPALPPIDAYCHTITDPSILGPTLRRSGAQTLTLFALHQPYRLFAGNNEVARRHALARVFASLDAVLDEPLESCLLTDADGNPCVQASTPVDLEQELGMPGGNIFHRPLQWPFATTTTDVGRWGVETEHPRILLAGAGAQRGGGVSGIAGRNAAMSVLGH